MTTCRPAPVTRPPHATVSLCAAAVVMSRLDLFRKHVAERLLRVRLAADRDYAQVLEPVFEKYVSDARLVSLETVQMGALQEVVYSVTLKPDVGETALLEAVRAVNDNQKVSLIVGQHEVDL